VGGGVVRSPWAVESKGRQNGQRAAQSVWKKVNFLRPQYFKLLSQIKEDPINKYRCFKVMTSVRVAIVTARLNGRGCWVLALK